jgi:hypothetical protein
LGREKCRANATFLSAEFKLLSAECHVSERKLSGECHAFRLPPVDNLDRPRFGVQQNHGPRFSYRAAKFLAVELRKAISLIEHPLTEDQNGIAINFVIARSEAIL